jgi:hypothetical protein
MASPCGGDRIFSSAYRSRRFRKRLQDAACTYKTDRSRARRVSRAAAHNGHMSAHMSAIVDGLHFKPDVTHVGARARGCYTCMHWRGEFLSGNLLCERDLPWRYVPCIPALGCVHWMRATGSDDE